MQRVKVKVIRSNRSGFLLRWKCPRERRWKERATGSAVESEARQLGAELQAQLNSGTYAEPSRATWDEFRDKYETQKLPSLAAMTEARALTALNCVEKLLRPGTLADIDAQGLSLLQERMRAKKLSENTIATNLAHFKAALNWAKGQGMLHDVPKFNMPKRTRKSGSRMRGRPLTDAEFERMCEAAGQVRPADRDAWCRLLKGLWLSGLRIAEAVELSWGADALVSVDLRGPRPLLNFDAEGQKSHEDERVPCTPDFAAFLLETPTGQRSGKVFPLLANEGEALSAAWAGKIIARIGKAAQILVKPRTGKYATAHDLRRSFGTRWAGRNLPPAKLRVLMRHASIETTLAYYVDLNADQMAAELFDQFPPGNVPRDDAAA